MKNQSIRDSISLTLLVRGIILVCIGQITCGQILPLIAVRHSNDVSKALEHLITRDGAVVLAMLLVVSLVFSFINRGSLLVGSALYTLYTLFVSFSVFHADNPYVGIMYVIYSTLGIIVIASLWEKRNG